MRRDPLLRFGTVSLISVLAATAVAAAFLPAGEERRRSDDVAPAAPAASFVEEDETPEPDALPDDLAALGVFADLAALAPAPGVDAFDVLHPNYMDGATAVRHVAWPKTGAVDVADDGAFTFPVGTVFAQTVSAPETAAGGARRLETRVLKKTSERWLAGTYVWNDAGNAAVLNGAYERALPVRLPGCDQDYVVPGRIACLQCHAGSREMPLGFAAGQLGRTGVERFAAAGRIATPERALAHCAIEASSDAERDALGYLAGNCAHCHSPASTSFIPAQLDLRPEFVRLAIGRESYRLQSPDARKVVVPGDPAASTMYRLVTRTLSGANDVARRMPPVGNQSADPHAAAVVERWIKSLTAADVSRDAAARSQ